jgi:mannose-1-phosphate guanylyltransferase
MLDFHRSNGGIATIALWEVEDPSRFGVADFRQESGKIMRFQEKPPIEEAYSNLINAGTYIIEPEIFNLMPNGAHSIERDIYEDLAETGGLNGFPYEGWFVDAGTPGSFIEATQVCISESRFSSGTVQGDSWFGKNSENLGMVSRSSVGSSSVISEGATITDSVILDNVEIGAGSVLDGCLIGNGVSVPEGTVMSGKIVDHASLLDD